MPSMQDHREQARLPLELEVEYQGLNRFFADFTKNISKSGTFVRTCAPFPAGTRLALRLRLPSVEEPLELWGEVVRSSEAGEAGMGIRFVWDDPARRAAFDAVVERLMEESLGPDVTSELLRGARLGR
jgi:type IV pilus assembly protein PilZ